MADGLTPPRPAAPRGPFRAATSRQGRRVALWGLVLAVAAVHGCVGERVAQGLAETRAADAMPPRIEVAYVREMAPTAPPPSARPAPPPRPKRAAKPKPPAPPASAPREEAPPEPVLAAAEPAASAAPASPDAVAADAAASAPTTVALAEPPADPALPASADPASAAPAAAATAPPDTASRDTLPGDFDWPVSTRVSYVLTGNYRGEVNGRANVEWIRVGTRYQVHLDMVVGPSFAPVITRKMTSDGEITADGLSPRRYDQQTRVMGSDRSPATLRFEPGEVVLANGNRTPSVPGVQDTASQFIQLTYVFGTRPELLEVGRTVEIPLALPHRVGVWTYDVVANETLHTPFGDLDAVHLKPRKRTDRPDEMTAEIWFAPQLRYLPTRIRIQQGSENYLDLVIDRRPEMAGS